MAEQRGRAMDISPARGDDAQGNEIRQCISVSWVEELSYRLTQAYEAPTGTARTQSGCLVMATSVVTLERDIKRIVVFKSVCHEIVLIGHLGGCSHNIGEQLRQWSYQIKQEKEIVANVDKVLTNRYCIIKVGLRAEGEELVNLNPHFVFSKIFLVQHWVPDFNPEKPITIRHALMVKVFGVPLDYQDSKVLSNILAPAGNVLTVELGEGPGTPPVVWIACYLAMFVPEIEIVNVKGQIHRLTLEYKDLDLRCWVGGCM